MTVTIKPLQKTAKTERWQQTRHNKTIITKPLQQNRYT